MTKSITIIGLGWLGGAFALFCKEKGHKVAGTVRNLKQPRRPLPIEIPVHAFSLGAKFPEPLCTPDETTAVIAISPSTAAMSSQQFEEGLKKLASNLTASRAARIVYISTTSVYPNHATAPKEADAEEIPSLRSGVSLLKAENAVIEGAGKTPVITIRFGGMFGPGREPGRFFIRRPLKYPDDPVNLIHLDDCIGILDLATELGETQVINAVAPHHPERGVFYTAAALAVGEQPPMSLGSASSGAPKRINIDHLTSNLGYTFIHPNPLSLYY